MPTFIATSFFFLLQFKTKLIPSGIYINHYYITGNFCMFSHRHFITLIVDIIKYNKNANERFIKCTPECRVIINENILILNKVIFLFLTKYFSSLLLFLLLLLVCALYYFTVGKHVCVGKTDNRCSLNIMIKRLPYCLHYIINFVFT